jgi:hypothetical protein
VADSEVTIAIKAKDEASAALNDVKKTAGGLKGALLDVGKVAGGFLVAGAVTEGAKQLVGQFGSIISEANESQKVLAQTEAVLKSTGGAAGLVADDLTGMAQAFQKTTTFSDEAVLSAENLLLTFTNIGKETFPDATAAVLDMSAALGQDLKSSSIQIGKALNDPIKGISALQRVGVSFTEQQKEQIQAMVAAGDAAGAQKLILAELAKEFGGSAAAQAKTFGGRMEQLRNQIGEVKEGIGLALMPALTGMANLMASKLVPALGTAVEGFSKFTAAASKRVQGIFTDIDPRGLVGILDRVKAALSEAFAPALESFRSVGPAAAEAFDDIVAAGKDILPTLEKLGREILPVVVELLNIAAEQSARMAKSVLELAGAIATGIAEIVQFADKLGLVDAAVLGLQTIVQAIGVAFDLLAPIVQKVARFFQEHKTAAIALAAALGIILIALFPVPAAILGVIVAIGLLRQHWDTIKQVTIDTWKAIDEATGGALSNIVKIVESFAELIATEFRVAFTIVRDIVRVVMAIIRGDWAEAWDALKKLASDVLDGIVEIIKARFALLRDVFIFVFEAIKTVAQEGLAALVDLWRAELELLYNVVVFITSAVVNWFGDLPGKITGALGDLSNLLYGAGLKVIQGFWDGLKDKWDDVKGWLEDRKNQITKLKGPPSEDAKMLYKAGTLVMGGFQRGLQDTWADTASWLQGVQADISGSMRMAPAGGPMMGFGSSAMAMPQGAVPGGQQMTMNGVTIVLPNVTRPEEFGEELMREQDRYFRGVA